MSKIKSIRNQSKDLIKFSANKSNQSKIGPFFLPIKFSPNKKKILRSVSIFSFLMKQNWSRRLPSLFERKEKQFFLFLIFQFCFFFDQCKKKHVANDHEKISWIIFKYFSVSDVEEIFESTNVRLEKKKTRKFLRKSDDRYSIILGFRRRTLIAIKLEFKTSLSPFFNLKLGRRATSYCVSRMIIGRRSFT